MNKIICSPFLVLLSYQNFTTGMNRFSLFRKFIGDLIIRYYLNLYTAVMVIGRDLEKTKSLVLILYWMHAMQLHCKSFSNYSTTTTKKRIIAETEGRES